MAPVAVVSDIAHHLVSSPAHYFPDGSIMAFTEIETGFAASVGLDEIANEPRPFALKHNVSFGDLCVSMSTPAYFARN